MTKEEYMNIALTLAKSTIGQTSPNPSVGAVVVKDGRIVGMGSHLRAGLAHAEVIAIEQAGDDAIGADVYVTLEPCSHHGKTPPCADLLIEHQVKRVYIACVDPNPSVAGEGIKKLKQAGIEVEVGIREAEALAINKSFFFYMQHKRPYVTLKAAMTLDGKTATKTGDSKWITGEAARKDVHKQRAIHDAIMVGVNTVQQDNPQLTTRLPQGGKNPIRIILDTQLSINQASNVLQDKEAPTWIVCGSKVNVEAFANAFPHITVLQQSTPTIRLPELLDKLGELDIQSLYVEGGSTVHGSFVKENLFQACHWYIAPTLLGGIDAKTVVGGRSPENMIDATQLTIASMEQIGSDIKVIAYPKQEVE
ncbi:riboflavin biosynthesis protein RibD [Paraliobacillus ryukyuensis]|uniref:Riboflavin biosynthesis protein RibD n=1 Tax=Paraliobacillus ryukyuensis TaxID=200904 RepID=A0A366EEA0_9BACI|nr:bifunctional diaminohydroxyphosphoribosylaminopyrimidine deaminase/5-amino-6-(5-phosphoribosylamino)uracil reductase RibD [Paraliobacillus ryukyuensis]RBO99738.1 diaminohydroxyphosphoribosylaminopyrimidine deaminase /5-amino-6-(5-phosphoribosylamino)uracil reductase [Paraliobacillus ryukyuensis]